MGLFKPKESRKYPRVSNSLRVNYQVADGTLYRDCLTEDISDLGIRLNLFRQLEVGTTLKLSIYFQNVAQPTLVIGKVAWIKKTTGKEYPYEAGIEFTLFDPSFLPKIKNHIQSISKEKKDNSQA